MLGLFTYSEICRSLLNICDTEMLSNHGLTPKGLRMSLQARARQFEPKLPLWDTESTVLVSLPSSEKLLCEVLEKEDSPTRSVENRGHTDHHVQMNLLRDALVLLRTLDPNLSEIMNASISCVCTSKNNSPEPTVPAATPGVIVAHPQNHWSVWDTLEFIVGSISKNLMVYDEFYHLHFHSHHALNRKDAYAQDVLIQNDLPLDSVLRSIAEGISILNLRANAVFQNSRLGVCIKMTTGLYPDSPTLAHRIRSSIQSVKANTTAFSLLSSRGRELLSRAQRRVDEFSEICPLLQV